MGGDDYAHDNAAIHPLYRLAGVNLDFKAVFLQAWRLRSA